MAPAANASGKLRIVATGSLVVCAFLEIVEIERRGGIRQRELRVRIAP